MYIFSKRYKPDQNGNCSKCHAQMRSGYYCSGCKRFHNKKPKVVNMKDYYIVEVLKGKAGKWYWRLKYGNGNVLAHAETYSSKFQAKKTAHNLAMNLHKCKFVCE